MKFLWVLMIFVLVSCSAPDIYPPVPVAAKAPYMSKAQIFSELKALSNNKSMQSAEKFTQEDMVRLNSLSDPRTFFGQMFKHKKFKNMKFEGQAEVDLRSRDTVVKSQDDGKCSVFAGIAAMENTMQRNGTIPGLHLSEWDAWSHQGATASCDAFIKASSKTKICDEKYYPQYGRDTADCEKTAYAKIASYTYLEDDVNAMTKALDNGNVVYIGMSTPNDVVKCKKIVSPNTTVSNGGHALVLVGYYKQDGQVMGIIRNSWGADCADNGYFYMPLTLCNRSDMYCIAWEIKSVLVDHTPEPSLPSTEPTCKSWKTIWWKPWAKKCVDWT